MKLDSENLYTRIKEALNLKTAPEIARKLGLAKQTVYDWQKGKWPGLETLIVICQSGDVSLHWLVTGEGPKELIDGQTESDILLDLALDELFLAQYIDEESVEVVRDLSVQEHKDVGLIIASLVEKGIAANNIIEVISRFPGLQNMGSAESSTSKLNQPVVKRKKARIRP